MTTLAGTNGFGPLPPSRCDGRAADLLHRYNIKAMGSLRRHKDNHAGLMNLEQMAFFQRVNGGMPGTEWEPFAGLDCLRRNGGGPEKIFFEAPSPSRPRSP